MRVVQYEHHGDIVSVREDLKGRHREHCLCWQDCMWFKPGSEDNCRIAQAVYNTCVLFDIVTPVWECPMYRSSPNLTAEELDTVRSI